MRCIAFSVTSPFLIRIRFWTILDLNLDPPGLHFGSLLAPKIAENSLPGGLGPSRSRSAIPFLGPGGVQERSKRPSGGQNKGTERATRAKRPPRGVQDRFGTHFGAILRRFWYLSGDILELLFKFFGASLALVAALASIAVLGVLCVARFPFHDSQVFFGR